MEVRFGGDINVYGLVVIDMKVVEKSILEWDLNKWKWDGDCFFVILMNFVFLDWSEIEVNVSVFNSLLFCFKEINLIIKKGKRELDKGSRIEVFFEVELNDEVELFNLKLGY